MKQKTTTYWCCLYVILSVFLSVGTLRAQIKITFPVERAIFQRDNANQATISVGGYYTEGVDRVEARLVPVLPAQGQATDWTVIQQNPQGGVFLGSLTGRGGWYTLEVRAFFSNNQIATDRIARVGIGEVFLVAGQSNAQGFFGFGATGATEDRVNTVTWDNQNSNNTNNPTLSFAQLTAETLIGPRGRSAWCWGPLGDLLARKLNVPILFMNAAWFDTSTQNWLDAAQGKPVQNRLGENLPAGMPYANLKASLQYYGSILGLRAVLWLQGENDAAARVNKEAYQNSLQGLINVARIEQGEVLSSLPWVFARTSRYAINGVSLVSQAIIDGQNAVINIPFNKSYGGPYTDNIQVPRPATNPVNGQEDGVHFQGQGLVDLARAWDNSLPPSFFATVVPVKPRSVVPITVTCNTLGVSINLRAADGFASYRWSNGQTTQTITVTGQGTYQATMKDNAGNTYLTPTLVINDPSVQVANPVISPSGEQIICADSSITLSVNVSTANIVRWSNGFVGRTISVRNPGNYTATVSNIYGCSAAAASAPVTIKTINIKAPTVFQSGPYSVQAVPDSTIFSFTDTKVSNITWEWMQGGRVLPFKESAIKATTISTYNTRSRVTFEAQSGGSLRTCLSPFSNTVEYRPTGTTDDGLILYPNPTRSRKIAVETLEDLKDVEITIVGLTGQVVYRKVMPNLNIRQEIDLSGLNEGAYIFKVKSATLNQAKRILIDK
ncbi:T9SS type A sorting domain-containing protein [Runella zeae]|uniref:T9SS type A sorting domain-containing protein n=1 Tax=Runella zeae TaxID=94255 RepID=UPI0003FF724E|nr:T9SS type A sorting domain-containing protein [Runella zeae]